MNREREAQTWRAIPGFGERYKASADGQIMAVYQDGRTRLLKPFLRLRGGDPLNRMALFVNLRAEGERADYPVINLVARTWIGPAPEGMLAVPRDGNIRNTAVSNVMYVTKEQLQHAMLEEIQQAAARGEQPLRPFRQNRRYRKAVLKINAQGEILARYASIHDAARANYMSDASVSARCDGKISKRWAEDGTTFIWEV